MAWLKTNLWIEVTFLCLFYSNVSPSEVSPPNITENCPRDCFCSKTLSSVNCAGKGLTSLPLGIPTKVVKLYLDHNKLTTIPPWSFKGMKDLVMVTLESNKLTTLPQNAFTGALALQTLTLTHNLIESVDPQAFDGLNNLKKLKLGANDLREIVCLSYTPNLQQLVMQDNELLDVIFPMDTVNLVNLLDITLTANQISSLSGIAFLALKKANVRRLDLQKNLLTEISEDTFLPLTMLQSLKLGMNTQLKPDILKKAFTGIKSSILASLDISGLAFDGVLDATIFEPLQNTSLNNLRLNQNIIRELKAGNFKYLKHLTHLDLTACHLEKISSYAFNDLNNLNQLKLGANELRSIPQKLPSSLNYLHLSSNRILYLHKGDFDGLKELQELYLMFNSILTLESETFSGLSSLKKLYLQGNKIATLPGQLFSSLQQLTLLDLSKNNLQQIPNESDVFSVMSSVQNINMADNLCKQVPQKLFTGMSELLNLNLANNLLGSVIEADASGNLFRGLLKIHDLNLRNNDIRSLPESSFRALIALNVLNLQNNKISQWPENTFAMTKTLETLDVSNNLISSINKTTLKDLKELKNLNLTGNPFNCNCELRWFRDWLKTTDVQIPGSETYKCTSPPGWQDKTLLSFNRNLIDCVDRTPYYVSGGVGAGVLITFVLLVLMYRYRWFVKLRVHRARTWAHEKVTAPGYEEVNGNNREYDAYISYCQADRIWIVNSLLPLLDNGQLRGQPLEGPFKLCINDRDFIPGESIVGNIDTCMRASRKIVIVLSKDYLKDGRCDFELKHAFHVAFVEQDVDDLILIKKGRLRPKEIPKIVNPMIEKRDFVEWPEDEEEGRQNFVEDITQRIRRPKPPNTIEI